MSYFIANWKLNGSVEMVETLLGAIPEDVAFSEVAICPPLPFLSALKQKGASISLGAQDCSGHESGAFTGEVSAKMVAEAGCQYVIVGHSERREHHSETNEQVRAKAEKAIESGLTPIICIGETLAEREAGFVLEVLEKQYAASVPSAAHAENCIIAYEPVWAIGTGKVASLEQVEAVHRHLKSFNEDMPLLYGGSVKPNNIHEICAVQGVDGVLVGSASIDPQQFAAMLTK
jgi:triosephosphate isomerase